MSRCRTCGGETSTGRNYCHTCLKNWTGMRDRVFTALQEKHGKVTPENLPFFKKEMKRIENIWRKDKVRFETEMEKLK